MKRSTKKNLLKLGALIAGLGIAKYYLNKKSQPGHIISNNIKTEPVISNITNTQKDLSNQIKDVIKSDTTIQTPTVAKWQPYTLPSIAEESAKRLLKIMLSVNSKDNDITSICQAYISFVQNINDECNNKLDVVKCKEEYLQRNLIFIKELNSALKVIGFKPYNIESLLYLESCKN